MIEKSVTDILCLSLCMFNFSVRVHVGGVCETTLQKISRGSFSSWFNVWLHFVKKYRNSLNFGKRKKIHLKDHENYENRVQNCCEDCKNRAKSRENKRVYVDLRPTLKNTKQLFAVFKDPIELFTPFSRSKHILWRSSKLTN